MGLPHMESASPQPRDAIQGMRNFTGKLGLECLAMCSPEALKLLSLQCENSVHVSSAVKMVLRGETPCRDDVVLAAENRA